MATYSITTTSDLLGITRDRLHYLIRIGVIKPSKVGREYQLSETELEAVREHLSAKGNPVRGLTLLSVESPHSRPVAEDVSKHREVIWSASVFGGSDVLALIETFSYEELARLTHAIQAIRRIRHTETYPVLPEQWHENPVRQRRKYFACTLIKIEASLSELVFKQLKLTKEVWRTAGLYGPWDFMVELPFDELFALEATVMDSIQSIRGVINTSTIIAMRDIRFRGSEVIAPTKR